MEKEIVFVSNFMGNGGAARVISILAKRFSEKGYQVCIITFPFDAKEYPEDENIEYIKVVPKNKSGLKRKFERIRLLRKELKKHPRAYIISFEYFMNMQTIVSTIGLKNKLIISERNDPASMGGDFPTNVIRNILYFFCDILVCQTPDAKAYFPRLIQKKTVIIPNPIKEDLPKPWTGERDSVIVTFCRLEKQKNLTLLIDAFELFCKRHQEYKLYIYGDGKEKQKLQQYVEKKGLGKNIIIHEAVSDVHERVKRSMMFVSTSNYEGLSNSMIEAMAIGLPTIATDCPCGGARMMINNGINGILIPMNEKKSLLEAMEKISSDFQLQKYLSENATKVYGLLQPSIIVKMWEEILVK